jgi:hypothetical protein
MFITGTGQIHKALQAAVTITAQDKYIGSVNSIFVRFAH